jgi:cytochrome c5
VTVHAETKGVSFGELTVWPDGLVDTSQINGIDGDLIVKPFGQKGVYTSLREFTLDALEVHHGLQGEERAGTDIDADEDGVVNELTIADTTALTIFQASLPPPFMDTSATGLQETYIERGEKLFESVGCAVCHKPYLELINPIYTEPNPFNPPGTLVDYEIPEMYGIDLFQNANSNAIRRTDEGTYLVYAYTDLKRHDMGPILANEKVEQRFIESAIWITRKLWGIMSEPPFLHHGRATLLQEAIDVHYGEAEASRTKYEGLSDEDKTAVIEFMKTFQMTDTP